MAGVVAAKMKEKKLKEEEEEAKVWNLTILQRVCNFLQSYITVNAPFSYKKVKAECTVHALIEISFRTG